MEPFFTFQAGPFKGVIKRSGMVVYVNSIGNETPQGTVPREFMDYAAGLLEKHEAQTQEITRLREALEFYVAEVPCGHSYDAPDARCACCKSLAALSPQEDPT